MIRSSCRFIRSSAKHPTRITRSFLLFPLLILSGCETLVNHEPVAPEMDELIRQSDRVINVPDTSNVSKPPASEDISPENQETTRSSEIELYPGTGVFVGDGGVKTVPARRSGSGDVTLNFQGTDIHEVVKVILGDLLSRNYVIDPSVTGTANIQTSEPLHRDMVLPVLENMLSLNGATLFDEGDLIRILPSTDAALHSLPPRKARLLRDSGSNYVTEVVPLRYISADEVSKILQPFIKNNIAYYDSQRNIVMLTGRQDELNRLTETIRVFDVDWLKGMSLALVPLDASEAKDVVNELDAIFGRSSESPLAELVRFVALERLNSIIVISKQPRYLNEMTRWIRRLDRSEGISGQRLYVYQVQNTRAADLAEVLNNVFGDSSSTTSTRSNNAALAPGLEPVTLDNTATNEDGTPAENSAQTSNTTQQRNRPSVSVVGGEGVSLPTAGQVKIIADETNNSLVILASPSDYLMVENALQQLDITPLQVLIEASIIEVALTDDLSYGLEWFFKNGIGSKTGQGSLDLGDANIEALAPGFSYAVVDAADTVRAVLNTLASESRVNVLSSPSLMVLDNHTASINVGNQVPITTRSSVSNLDATAPTVNEIEYRDTGVLLTVTPRVNESGLIIMEVKQEVSNVLNTDTNGLDTPTINQRTIESTIAVDSGNTIVLGGLINDNRSETNSGIPGLRNAPLIGPLFSQTSNSLSRTELIVLLTPRAIADEEDAWRVTNEFREKLQELGRDLRQEEYRAPETTEFETGGAIEN